MTKRKKNVGAHRWSFIYEYIFCKCFPHKIVDVVFFCACDRFKSESHCQSHRMTHLKYLGCIISAPGHRNSSCQCQWVADPLMTDAPWLCHLNCLVFRGKTANCNYLLHQICFLVYIPDTISFCLGIIFSHMWTQCITTRKFHLSTCLKNRMAEQVCVCVCVCVWERYEILWMCLPVCMYVCVWAEPSTFVLCMLLSCITHCLYAKQVTSNIWDAVEIDENRPSKSFRSIVALKVAHRPHIRHWHWNVRFAFGFAL